MHNSFIRTGLLALVASTTLGLAGCYTYPVGYRPVATQRLTPEQTAAIQGNAQLSQADRDRLTQDNTTVVQGSYAPAPAVAYTPAPVYYDNPYYYSYPYYGGYYGGYPFYPALGLSFRFGGGYRGGFHGGGSHGGGFHHR